MTAVAVCVCTYRRPAQLERLLDSLARIHRPSKVSFIVIDNDGTDPAIEAAVMRFGSLCGASVTYAVEPAPGISAARNRAFATARHLGADAVAMLDDDEWASPYWLVELLETRNSTGARVVGGPVHPVFPDNEPGLQRYKRLWSIHRGRLDGRVYVSCTCNCLVDLAAAVEILGDSPFPTEFAFSGGEDAVFFRRLHSAGVKMAWSEHAVLFEEYRGERANFGWMRRRWYRQGNVGLRCERAAPGPRALPPLLKTALLFGRLPVYPLFNRDVFAMPRVWLLECDRLRGRVAAHFGLVFEEYARPAKAV